MLKIEEKSHGSQPGKEKQGPNYGVFDRFIMRLESKLNDVRYDFLS